MTAIAESTEYRQGTPAWVEARLAGIGSSDAPVVMGESPYRSPYALWAEKTGVAPAEEPDEYQARLFRLGHTFEPLLLQLYSEETGRKVRRVPRMLRRRDRPWMLASLDGRVVGDPGRIVEAKWTNAVRWNEPDDVPIDVQVQVQHAMEVTGAEVADVVALVRASLRIVEVPRDPDFIADILAIEEEFWAMVQERRAPVIDGSESARRSLLRQYPRDLGPMLEPTEELRLLADALAEAQTWAAEADDKLETTKNAIRAAIGEAAGMVGPGYKITWTKNRPSRKTDWEAVAREMWLSDPAGFNAAVEQHTTEIEGARVLRARFDR